MAKTKMRTVDMSIVPEDVKGAAKMKLPKNTKKVKAKKPAEDAVVVPATLPEETKPQREPDIIELIEQANRPMGDAVAETEAEADEAPKKVRAAHIRSKKYHAARAQVDRTKNYELKRAVEFLKKTSYSAFTGTITIDAVAKDEKLSVEVVFPHTTGRTTRVVIATDEVLAEIDKGVINFDILIATPALMPKLAKYARTLGPKGLMPNPKNGTVTTDPDKRLKELSAGKLTVKTEKKAPLLHVVVGKTDMDEKQVTENVEALIKAIGGRRLKKLVISATMSPGIKVDLTPYQVAA